MDYEKDIHIDPTALDVEWLEQPNLMLQYARVAVTARRDADLAKEELEMVKAELDKDIRTNPDKYGIAKITEGVVTNTILLQLEYKEASEKYINAKYEQEMSRYAAQAISDRKDALENLVKLHGMQYFAGPSTPRDLVGEWDRLQKERRKESNALVSESIKKKRKRTK